MSKTKAPRSGYWAGVARFAAPVYCTLVACSGVYSEPPPGQVAQEVVYGQDGRVEAFMAGSQGTRHVANNSVVALIADSALTDSQERDSSAPEAPGQAVFGGASLRARAGVCSDTRFAEQPAPAACTGVLVSPDLVLTAGHCTRRLPCEALNLVFGFYYRSELEPEAIEPQDWYRCAEVVLEETPNALSALDFAFIRLDRVVQGRAQPLALDAQAEALQPGAELQLFGFGQGLPLKVQAAVRVTDSRPDTLDYFVSDADAFGGDSGGPLLDRDGRLRGILVNGRDDYAATLEGCLDNAHYAHEAAAERATYAFQAHAALCQQPELAPHLCAAETTGTPTGGAAGGCSLAQLPPAANAAALVAWALCALGLRSRRRVARRSIARAPCCS